MLDGIPPASSFGFVYGMFGVVSRLLETGDFIKFFLVGSLFTMMLYAQSSDLEEVTVSRRTEGMFRDDEKMSRDMNE